MAAREAGDVAAGIEHLRQGAAGWRSQGSDLWRPYWLALLSEAYGKAGQIDEALAALTEALSIVERTGESFYEAELYRLKGELTLRQFNVRGSTFGAINSKDFIAKVVATVEPFFGKASEISRRQQAKSLELRATMSFARLLAKQGKRDEARTMLAEIYGWFTEGFDTADLKDAKALLDQLNG
jgi:predicted ATPase